MLWERRSQSGLGQAGEVGRNTVEYCGPQDASETEGNIFKTVARPAMLLRARNVGYNEETRKTD